MSENILICHSNPSALQDRAFLSDKVPSRTLKKESLRPGVRFVETYWVVFHLEKGSLRVLNP